MTELTMQQRLECPFAPSAVSWRIGRKTKDGKKAALLAYIDARDVMERLDDAVGFDGWQCRYSLAVDGLLICELGLLVNGNWLWRANGAGDTQVEAEKGKCSDAFKRAAVLFGVGRYLYGLPSPYVDIDEYGKWAKDPALPTWATPDGYVNGLQKRADSTLTGRPHSGVFESLDADAQIGVAKIAASIKDFMDAGNISDGYDYYQKESATLDTDEKAALNGYINKEVKAKINAEFRRRNPK